MNDKAGNWVDVPSLATSTLEGPGGVIYDSKGKVCVTFLKRPGGYMTLFTMQC